MQQQRERAPSQSYFWPVVWAVSLHLLLFITLFVSFQFTPELPPARPIVQTTLYQLKSQSQATTQTPQKIAGDAKKTSAPSHQVEQLETKKVEQQKQAAAEKAVAEKKAVEQKKAAAEAAKKKAADDAAKKKQAAQAASRKSYEDKKAQALAEMMSESTQYQQAQADTVGSQVAGSLDDLIVKLVSMQWQRPPSARNGMSVEVQIEMLPDGTITNASVTRSSGDAPFDSSAVAAVRNVGRIAEMQQLDRATFDAMYRKRRAVFSPEDLAL